ESGDLIAANAGGSFDWERATELGTVLAQSWKAPEEPGITVFESHGLALWDLAAASVVLPAAIQRGLGEEVSVFSIRPPPRELSSAGAKGSTAGPGPRSADKSRPGTPPPG